MERDWIPRLNAFYAAYMAYFGAEADVVSADDLDAQDRATIAGLRAASVDTDPKGRDVEQARCASIGSAVAACGETPKLSGGPSSQAGTISTPPPPPAVD